jgi:hypothetical protein
MRGSLEALIARLRERGAKQPATTRWVGCNPFAP